MIKYIVIANDEDTIRLNVGVDLNKVDSQGNNILFMPSLTFDVKGTGTDIYWDNEDFIFGNFKKWLEGLLANKLSELEQNPEFDEVYSFFETDDQLKEMLDMLNLAIKEGWDKSGF